MIYIYRSKTQEIIWSFIRRTLCFMHYTFFSCYYEKTGVADYLLNLWIFVDVSSHINYCLKKGCFIAVSGYST